jgi:hypothetical protein
MCLPKLDHGKEEKPACEDPVASWLNQTGAGAADEGGAQERSAREAAERAIREFQKTIFDLTFDQAKEAYIRLLAARGFNRDRSLTEDSGQAPSSAPAHDAVISNKKEAT